MKLRVAFVVQRYGVEISGGAEQLCRAVAERLDGIEPHVLTTCASDHNTWANDYPPGTTELNGVPVHRFAVAAGRAPDFDQYSARVLGRPCSPAEEREWLAKQGPTVPELLAHLRERGRTYDAVVFFTYLYSLTVDGLPLVADRSVLVPTAHDEPPIHLALYRDLFAAPRFIAYLTPGERRLVRRLFDVTGIPSGIVGTGVELASASDPERFRHKYGLTGDVLLYVGRVEPGKGCAELLRYFAAYKRARPGPLRLVLAGWPAMDVPCSADVLPLGFISDADKIDALAAATVVVNPSPMESLSILTLEAWLAGRPALVNGRCDVLVDHCHASNAGLYYVGCDEFAACLDLLLARPDLRERLGRNGRRYVAANYAWPVVERRYLDAIRVAASAPE